MIKTSHGKLQIVVNSSASAFTPAILNFQMQLSQSRKIRASYIKGHDSTQPPLKGAKFQKENNDDHVPSELF